MEVSAEVARTDHLGALFFENLDQLAAAPVRVDRPRGSVHPGVPAAVYPVDYGYLDGTTSGDGDGIDVFVGSAAGPGVVVVELCAPVAVGRAGAGLDGALVVRRGTRRPRDG